MWVRKDGFGSGAGKEYGGDSPRECWERHCWEPGRLRGLHREDLPLPPAKAWEIEL